MSRVTPIPAQGFSSTTISTFGPRQMGVDADGALSVATQINQILAAMATFHDNGTATRPTDLPANGMWMRVNAGGDKDLCVFDGQTDNVLITLFAAGGSRVGALATASAPGIVRPDGETIEVDNDGVLKATVQGAIFGEIRLLPFRVDELPDGWYFCNGDLYPLTSAVGQALNKLSSNFKSDWGITVTESNISIPSLFHVDGRGLFLRPVDGVVRQVGSVELDTMQNVTGSFRFFSYPVNSGSGPFSATTQYSQRGQADLTPAGPGHSNVNFDLSAAARTSDETRPLSAGASPAMFLGV